MPGLQLLKFLSYYGKNKSSLRLKLRSSLDSLAKNLGQNDFKDLSQEFGSEVLNLAYEKVFPYEHMLDFETLPSKTKFNSSLNGKGISDTKSINIISKL